MSGAPGRAEPTGAALRGAMGSALIQGQRATRSSLTRQLLLWSLSALALVWGSFVFLGYQTGVHEADELTDGHLASVAALLLNLRATEAVAGPQMTERTATPWLKAHDYQQSISVVQWDAQGRLLALSGSAPEPRFSSSEGFANLTLGAKGSMWRSFSQWDAAKDRKIMVLLELRERDELAQDIAEQMVEPGLWLLPVVAIALGLAIRRGLRPLYDLSRDVAVLDPASAERLTTRHAWSEFESVVASINTLLERQRAAMARERRLANEVAHELRTPLSSIALQASALGKGLDAGGQAQAVARIGQDALRAGHVLNQLLALARASRAELHDAKTHLDLAGIGRAVCADYAQTAWQRGDDIALMVPGEIAMQGHAVLLDLALRNLMENALKHTPEGTHIAVQMGWTEAGAPWLQVCDDGARDAGAAGVAPTVAAADSLHLGHEIVRRVAEVHGATFGAMTAPAPFTTCYRLEFAATSLTAGG